MSGGVAPVGRTPRTRRIDAVVAASIAVIGAVAAFLRLTPLQTATMWAEDANVFSARAVTSGGQPWWIWTPYGGYTHALPQLIADILWPLVPAGGMASAITIACCAVAGGVAATVFGLTARWGLPLVPRILLGLAVLASPGSSTEVLGNLANLHWLLLYLSPFLFLWRPRSWVGVAAIAAGVLLVTTSEIQSLLFAPLLVIAPRTRRLLPAAAAVLVGGGAQAAALVATSASRTAQRPSPVGVVRSGLVEVPLQALVGSARAAGEVVATSGWVGPVVAVVPFVLAVALAWRRVPQQRVAIAALAAGAVILWSAGFGLNYSTGFDWGAVPAQTLPDVIRPLRYAAVPIMMLVALVVLAGAGSARPRGALSIPALALVLCIGAVGFHVDDVSDRRQGPDWSTAVDAARTDCAGLSDDAAVFVPAAPGEYWGLATTCAVLGR